MLEFAILQRIWHNIIKGKEKRGTINAIHRQQIN